MEAIVMKSTGKWYRLKNTQTGEEMDARVRGKMRLKGFRSTNPIAVGDLVDVQQTNEDFVITKIFERKNFLLRRSTKLSKRSHIIAANIDLVLLIASLKEPETSFSFIDRILASCEANDLKVVIILNKVDLIGDDDASMDVFASFCETYESIGYRIVLCSAETGRGLDELKDLIKGKTCLLTGHSGVGKSSLVNQIEPGLKLRTSEISDYHKTGTHTTTFAEMHALSMGSYLIDTPGIRGFGIIDIDKNSLSHFFPEMKDLLPDCRFYNCRHINEPDCAILEAVANGKIPYSRYKSYLTILEDDEDSVHRQKDI